MSNDEDREQSDYTFGSVVSDDFDDLMTNDGDDENAGSVSANSPTDLELLQKIFSDDIKDEDVLFILSERSSCGLPQLVLKKRYIAEPQFDFLRGLLNVMQRLLQLDDDVLGHWMGGGEDDDEQNPSEKSILGFLFKTVDNYFERIVGEEMVDLGVDSDDLTCFRTLSHYDLICSVTCAFVALLNEEHLNIAEEILFDNLLSGSFIPASLAADVFVFIARGCTSSTFTHEFICVLFSLLDTIYVEDEHLIKEEAKVTSAALLNLTGTREILLQLLGRIFGFLERNDVDLIKAKFSLEQYLHIWKHIKRGTSLEELKKVASSPSNSQNRGFIAYDKLWALTAIQDSQKNIALLSSLVSGYVDTADEYQSLLYLRLLVRTIKSLDCEQIEPQSLPPQQMNALLDRAKKSLFVSPFSATSSSSSLEVNHEGVNNNKCLYRSETVEHILRLVNTLATSEDTAYESEPFQRLLKQLLLQIYRTVEPCFISRQAFFTLLVNLTSNPLFEAIIGQMAQMNRKVKVDLSLFIRHNKSGWFMKKEERELYVESLTKAYFDMLEAEDDAGDIDLSELLLLPHWAALVPKTHQNNKRLNLKRNSQNGTSGRQGNKRIRPSATLVPIASSQPSSTSNGYGGSISNVLFLPLFKTLQEATDMATEIQSANNNPASAVFHRSEQKNAISGVVNCIAKAVNHLKSVFDPR